MEKNAINVAQQLSLLDFEKKRRGKKVNFNEFWDHKDTSGGWISQVFNHRMCIEKNSVNYVATKVDLCMFIRPQCSLLIFA